MKIIIKDVQKIKEGYGKKGPWSLYKVTDSNNVQYSTFEEKYTAMLGMEVDVEVEVKQNGKYTNRTILEPRKQVQAPKNPQNDEILAVLKGIAVDLEEIKEIMLYRPGLPEGDKPF